MSMYYPNTIDQRRINNADGKILLQNWVEERATQKYDQVPEEYKQANKPINEFFKNGHKCLLTLNESAPNKEKTTYTDDYIKLNTYDPDGETKGIRYKLTEQAVRDQILKDEKELEKYAKEETNYVSVAKESYVVPGFVHQVPKPTTRHDVYAEMPVSYWTEKRNKVHGVTQFKTIDSPFKRNAAFSTPVEHSYNNARPGELENYPYMSESNNNNAAIF